MRKLRDDVAAAVRGRLDVAGLAARSAAERRLHVREEALAVLGERGAVLPARELRALVGRVSDEVIGLGPIESLLKDPEVSEVMVNGVEATFVERKGRLERVPHGLFEGEESVYHLIERVVGPLGLRVDESCPYVDARLPDGSRFHAIIPPLSLCGPTVTVRKFGVTALTPDDLVGLGSASAPMVAFLGACVSGRANLLVSGGAASGKTTLLGALATFIPAEERVVTIEDAAELRLPHPHVIRLESRPPSVEGRGGVTVRDLVRNALRMRPDRILVGEVRGGEALDMLQAMNTGHEGSMSTAHANSARDLIGRLEAMALMSGVGLPVSHIREQIGATIDLIVHLARHPSGRRAISSVVSVDGMLDGRPILREVFAHRWREDRFEATGHVPRIARLLVGEGAGLDPDLFRPTSVPARATA